MATSAPGQSSGKKEAKEKKIQYELLNLNICSIEQRATCNLVMPSNLSAWFKHALAENPSLILDVKHRGQDIHCIELMRHCLHRNILHARIVMEKGAYLLVWTDYYTGGLLTYLTSGAPFIPDHGEVGEASMIPSSQLQSVMIQMLDGMNALWLYDKYHGDLSLENTCYHKTADGDIVVKLTGFVNKGRSNSVSHYQASDLRSVCTVLSRISEIAEELNKKGYKLDCYQVDQLVESLKKAAMGDMKYAMNDIKREPFFWTSAERKNFFVSKIPLAMQSDFVREKVGKAETVCTLPWNMEDYAGFLSLMVNYRILKKKKPYDYTCRISYVYFISGIYAHEVQLKHPTAEVDTTVMSVNGRLFQILHSLVPSDLRPVNQ